MTRLEREWAEATERKYAAKLKAHSTDLAMTSSATESGDTREYRVRPSRHAALVRVVPGETNAIIRNFDHLYFAKRGFAQLNGAAFGPLHDEVSKVTATMTATVSPDSTTLDTGERWWGDPGSGVQGQREGKGDTSTRKNTQLGIEKQGEGILMNDICLEISAEHKEEHTWEEKKIEKEWEGGGGASAALMAEGPENASSIVRELPPSAPETARQVACGAASSSTFNLASNLLDTDIENELLEAEAFVSSQASAIFAHVGGHGPTSKVPLAAKVAAACPEEVLEVQALEQERWQLKQEQTQALRVLSELLPQAAEAEKKCQERITKVEQRKECWGKWANVAVWQVGARYDPTAPIAPARISHTLWNGVGLKQPQEDQKTQEGGADEDSPVEATFTGTRLTSKPIVVGKKDERPNPFLPMRCKGDIKWYAEEHGHAAALAGRSGCKTHQKRAVTIGPIGASHRKRVAASEADALSEPAVVSTPAKCQETAVTMAMRKSHVCQGFSLRSLFLGGAATDEYSLLKGSHVNLGENPSHKMSGLPLGFSLLGGSKAAMSSVSTTVNRSIPHCIGSRESTAEASIADDDALDSATFIAGHVTKGHAASAAIADPDDFLGSSFSDNSLGGGGVFGTSGAHRSWAIRSQAFMRTEDERSLRKYWRRGRSDARQAYRKLHRDTLRQQRRNQRI